MEKQMKKSFLLTATEAELIVMPLVEILKEVAERYNDLHDDAKKGEVNRKVAEDLDCRIGHTSILFEEGKRLSVVYPEIGKHLIAASIYWQETRGMEFLTKEERTALITRIEEIEREKKEKHKENIKK